MQKASKKRPKSTPGQPPSEIRLGKIYRAQKSALESRRRVAPVQITFGAPCPKGENEFLTR